MAYTVLDLITDSLMDVGVLPHSSTPQAWQTQRAFRTLNLWVDMKKADSFYVYNTVSETYPLTTAIGAYTIGPGGDFDTLNKDIISISAQIQTQSQLQEYPMTTMSVIDWQNVSVKGIQSTWPNAYYVDNAWPLRTINFWPVPAQTCNAVIYSQENIPEFTALTQVLDLPYGYKYCLVKTLALSLCPQYSISPSPLLVQQAAQSLANVERSNMIPEYQYADAAFNMGGDLGRYNVLTNSYTSYAIRK